MSLFCGLKFKAAANTVSSIHNIVAGYVAYMDMADVSNIEFDRALKFSLTERGTPDLKLKTQQLEALRAVVQQKRDVLAVLPTGYGTWPIDAIDHSAARVTTGHPRHYCNDHNAFRGILKCKLVWYPVKTTYKIL